MELTNGQAFELFKEVRWGTGEEVTCPVCGTIGKYYFQRTRKQWRCKDCNHTHKFGNLYLANYANEAAYREDTRRWANGRIFTDIMTKCARTLTNRDWCG